MKLLCLVLGFVSSLCFSAPQLDADQQAFFDACEVGDSLRASLILQRNPQIDINARTTGSTPLYIACPDGRFDVVKFLLENRAEVDKSDINDGWTPLHAACDANFLKIAEALLKKGADVNKASDYGMTALDAAVWNCKLDTVSLLIKYGATINVGQLQQGVEQYRRRQQAQPALDVVQNASTSLSQSFDFEFLA